MWGSRYCYYISVGAHQGHERETYSFSGGVFVIFLLGAVAKWQGSGGDNCPPPLNFSLSEQILLVGKFY